jgi:predicted kinase
MEAVILIGVQGGGKTSFFREHFLHTHVRISLDVLRKRHRE